jgi:uncharacterized protein
MTRIYHPRNSHFSRPALVTLVLLTITSPSLAIQQQDKSSSPTDSADAVSEFGKYSGFSKTQYHQFVRTSVYVPTRDGTRIAVDIYRPAIDGKAVQIPLPVLFAYSRYWRATRRPDGSVVTDLGTLPPGQCVGELGDQVAKLNWFALLVGRGYVYVRADARGTGGSHGYFYGEMSGVEARDGYDLVEWLARQSWGTGKVGMLGRSYLGMTQFLVASETPPHLSAIFPAVTSFDEYDIAWRGTGVLGKYGLEWLATYARRDGVGKGIADSKVNPLDVEEDSVARTDDDPRGESIGAAMAERRLNPAGSNPLDYFTAQSPAFGRMLDRIRAATKYATIDDLIEVLYSSERLEALLKQHPELRQDLLTIKFYRDEVPMMVSSKDPQGRNNLAVLAKQIAASHIPVYNWGGWYDFATRDTTLWYANLSQPKRLTIGPWSHRPESDPRGDEYKRLYGIEQLRWFDYWLKGIKNGVVSEVPIHYALMKSAQTWEWKVANDWPPHGLHSLNLYLSSDRAHSAKSINDGTLQLVPFALRRQDSFRVDYSASAGTHTRYHHAITSGRTLDYSFLVEHAAHALTYTTKALDQPIALIGAPIVRLYVSADVPDIEIDAYLEDVDENGAATFVSDGVMLASHRKLGTPFYNAFGVPWSSSTKADVDTTAPINTTVGDLEFSLQPSALEFAKGHRIRLVVTGADANTNLTIPYAASPVISVHLGTREGSRLVVPVDPAVVQSDP